MATPPESADVTIRDAERSDLESVVAIERAAFDQPWPYTAFERFLGESGFLVAVKDREVGHRPRTDTVVGYVVGDVTPNFGRDIGHVKDLAVADAARRCGIGRSLLVQSLAALAVDGAEVVKLEVRESNDPARTLYRDVGFDVARRVSRYYRDGEDALVMVLDVAAWRGSDAGEAEP
ncbi:ribosomal-protein-alanine N-acetyltransferase [Haloplanus rubicundus]|uniref:Ribosomal-protein-alanine N-acetyltransferase n=1 Tax=Haloplanus rubicundus TaxID=1547898 RepID=A0A345E0Q3_9EURY|nr:ribosomal protein S18-alanine N-acetyltransferase [Haloplanus rubicundus]AXG05775.1 ribosomal-protein-alanine N-acetyltransferase [Haloplanus rubicundus]AXG09112.1 ribosomal-protein-alanine N-acetyltransferase [Haloplanus rubicundus]